ncbi:MAG: hypothetical protein JJU45_19510 [Acidimicrobiia bacterium]|nr:hypothetical protein [Acidimicrobiia bacterium]
MSITSPKLTAGQAIEIALERERGCIEAADMLAAVVADVELFVPEVALLQAQLLERYDPDAAVDVYEQVIGAGDPRIDLAARLGAGRARLVHDLEDPQALELVASVYVDGGGDARLEAACHLAQIRDSEVSEVLAREALGHPDPSIQGRAALALGRALLHRDPLAAQEFLRGVVAIGDPEERWSAEELLEEMEWNSDDGTAA